MIDVLKAVGVVDDRNVSESLASLASEAARLAEWTRAVERDLFHADLAWRWVPSNGYLNLRIFGDDSLGVVSRTMQPHLEGWDCDGERVAWDGDTFSAWGWVSLRPMPTVEYDGVVEPDWAAIDG